MADSSHPLACVCGAVAGFERRGHAIRIKCPECPRCTAWVVEDKDGIAKHELGGKWQNWVGEERDSLSTGSRPAATNEVAEGAEPSRSGATHSTGSGPAAGGSPELEQE